MEECAKTGDARGVLAVFKEAKGKSVQMNHYMFQIVLNLCSNAADCGSLKVEAFEVYEDMKKVPLSGANARKSKKNPVDESCYSALLKLSSRAQDFDTCRKLIAEMEEGNVSPKLRSFSPLLLAYSDAELLDECFWVFQKLKQHELEPTETEYLALLKICTVKQETAKFYETLEEYIDIVLQPNQQAWEVLRNWFTR